MKSKSSTMSESAVAAEDSAARASLSSGYVNIRTWGVRTRTGDWVQYSRTSKWQTYPAKHLIHREAVEIFNTHPDAFQLIDGCDMWACLTNQEEALVVKEEKMNVPVDEAVSGSANT